MHLVNEPKRGTVEQHKDLAGGIPSGTADAAIDEQGAQLDFNLLRQDQP